MILSGRTMFAPTICVNPLDGTAFPKRCTKTLIAGAQNQNIFMKNARLTPTGILVSSLTALIYWIVLPNSRSFAK